MFHGGTEEEFATFAKIITGGIRAYFVDSRNAFDIILVERHSGIFFASAIVSNSNYKLYLLTLTKYKGESLYGRHCLFMHKLVKRVRNSFHSTHTFIHEIQQYTKSRKKKKKR